MPTRTLSVSGFRRIYAKRGTLIIDRLTYLRRRARKGITTAEAVSRGQYPYPAMELGDRLYYTERQLKEYDEFLSAPPLPEFAGTTKADARLYRKLMRDFA